ncbi:leukocyte elastase inhibitor [Aedes albopictus]|uniref:Serpin domain-containing protein n=1 Tax=Aedes albopictus TaxID=7160 RepID=A0ABM1YNI7_AEDAL
MKLLIVLSVCLVLTKAQKHYYGPRRNRQTTTVAPDNSNNFTDERDCDETVGAGADPWACLCKQFNFQRETCKEDIQKYLPSQPNSRICTDHRHYYIGLDNRCQEEHALESSNDPAGKAMQFALDLFQAADNKNPNENFIISPLSPQVLLAQLIESCSPKAREEMLKVLKLNGKEAASLVDALAAAANKDSTNNKLDIASVFFKAKDLELKTPFRDAAKHNNIRMKDLDFANAHQAANIVNEWANTQTRGNIPQVITDQGISPDMMMLLVNAIYFKGTWLYKFNETETNKRATFESSKNNKMPVHMMSQTNKLRFGEINYGMYSDSEQGLRWVELPYDGDELSMIVLLPKTQFQLDEMVRRANGSHFQEIFQVIRRNHNPLKIHLKMPRFTIKTSVSLVEPLKKLGIREIFEDDNPLPELFKSPARVGDVKQDAFLKVDELGTTATAVSRVTIIPLSLNYNEDIYFNCNEPFMVMVVDKTRQIPLFMAKIRKPEKPKADQGRVQA